MKNDVTAIAKSEFSLIDENMLKSRIYTIRGLKVILDADLAESMAELSVRSNKPDRYTKELKKLGIL